MTTEGLNWFSEILVPQKEMDVEAKQKKEKYEKQFRVLDLCGTGEELPAISDMQPTSVKVV